MHDEDGTGTRNQGRHGQVPGGQTGVVSADPTPQAPVLALPDQTPLFHAEHAERYVPSLLADFTGVMIQQARSALARTNDLVKEALRSNPDRSAQEVERLAKRLRKTLVEVPRDHSAVFGVRDAEAAGLPILAANPRGEQWQAIWRLWAKYYALDAYVCEGRLASQVVPRG
jgi:hypothetical protein